MPRLCFLTRTGFEAELQLELKNWATALGDGSWSLSSRPGVVLANLKTSQWQSALDAWPDWRRFPVFAREVVQIVAECLDTPRDDRIAPVLAVLPPNLECTAVRCYTPDQSETRALEPLARSLEGHLARSITTVPGSNQELHLILLASDHVLVGLASKPQRAPFVAGVPRLKLAKAAPSRSALKLEEALLSLLEERERMRWLRPGQWAVDLGAAPGGWTFAMVQRGLRVVAVDNGPMQRELMLTRKVEHVRADGFKFRPARPVDWLLSDMVEQPLRVAKLVRHWLDEGWTQRAIVNLKLPMKRRAEELQRCLQEWRGLDVRCKQLYHDREEVTAVVLAR